MEKLYDKKQIEYAINSYNKIFKAYDPFSLIFRDNIESKTLIFNTEGYFLSESQFNLLFELIQRCKESYVYLSITEFPDNNFYKSEHWRIPVDIPYEEYLTIPVYLENAIYSSQGEWGLIISHEEHAVLGGGEEFIRNFKQKYVNHSEDIRNFKEYYQYCNRNNGVNIDWLESFLKQF